MSHHDDGATVGLGIQMCEGWRVEGQGVRGFCCPPQPAAPQVCQEGV
ncbi:SEPT1 isoform 5 [Pan troglodytes]|uniref:SEPT1 isoform 5 n=1 Tax=Pan troglodytes TaxID=9598 RepID=A0A2J8INZ2_PANTR|nr:SEPT1 isoform 5 [Pan troglodytes]